MAEIYEYPDVNKTLMFHSTRIMRHDSLQMRVESQLFTVSFFNKHITTAKCTVGILQLAHVSLTVLIGYCSYHIAGIYRLRVSDYIA